MEDLLNWETVTRIGAATAVTILLVIVIIELVRGATLDVWYLWKWRG